MTSYRDGGDYRSRTAILEKLRAQIARGEPVGGGGTGTGTGISAQCEEAGGIDLIIIDNPGRYRMAGRVGGRPDRAGEAVEGDPPSGAGRLSMRWKTSLGRGQIGRRALFAPAALTAALGLLACANTPALDRAGAAAGARLLTPGPADWKPVFQGVDHLAFQLSVPRLIRGHAVRVDLDTPGIELVTTADNGEAPGETSGLRTTSFVRASSCQVAVNAAPFSPVLHVEGKGHDVHGLAVSGGRLVSPADEALPALLVRPMTRITIAERPFDLEGVELAVSGFHIVLKDGEVLGDDAPLHPRTAAAVSRDGRTLYLLVVDGRQRFHSRGASTAEIGQLLRDLGGWNGINLDGGGTTTLAFAGRGAGGEPGIVNQPIHRGIPGHERVTASHLGVRARPLETATPAAPRSP